MFQELDGPSKQDKITITAATPVRVKVGSTELNGRQVITIQPLTGTCRVYFADDNESPSAATVLAKGFKQRKEGIRTYEASSTQWVYILSESGSIDVIIAERA